MKHQDVEMPFVITAVFTYAIALIAAIVAIALWAGHLTPDYRLGYFQIVVSGLKVLTLVLLALTLRNSVSGWDKGFERFSVALVFLTALSLASGIIMIFAKPAPTEWLYEPVINFILMFFSLGLLWYVKPAE